jgi:hypothetical protein
MRQPSKVRRPQIHLRIALWVRDHLSRTPRLIVSPPLTWLVPQPRHKHPEWPDNPWSERFDRIFRNEGVGGSNPPSSTLLTRGFTWS